MFALTSPTAESLVSAGWRQLGKVRVTVHPRYAYEQLWQTARDTVLYLLLIYAAALVALQLFLRGLLRPLVAVEQAALAISARDFVTLRLRPGTRELARVVEAMNTMSEKMREAMDAESRRASQMQAAAYRDAVTGLLNARGFVDRFESVYEAEAGSFRGTFAMTEIADLGAINRQVGPERCDDLLRIAYRPIDDAATAAGGFAGRWTGALTVFVLPGSTGDSAQRQLAALRERALAALRELGVEQHGRVHCAGVEASGPAPLNTLIRAVEEALLRAREVQGGVLLMPASRRRA
jgi:GGDEF domain-containing protein